MKNKKILIIIFIIICSAIAIYSMSGVLTPYVSVKSAKESGNFVQIIGALDKTVPVKHEEGYFVFEIKDRDGSRIKVLHQGDKPQNFEHADQIVAQGYYNSKKDIFEAEKLLVKCPSKYTKAK